MVHRLGWRRITGYQEQVSNSPWGDRLMTVRNLLMTGKAGMSTGSTSSSMLMLKILLRHINSHSKFTGNLGVGVI